MSTSPHPAGRPPATGGVPANAPVPVAPLDTDPVWFRRSVFYEVLVRGFFDSNDDGTGDLRGITAKDRKSTRLNSSH